MLCTAFCFCAQHNTCFSFGPFSSGRGIMGPNKHESFPHSNIHLYTWLVVLTVAPAWRSLLTTLEWPLEDASISAVSPLWETVEGCYIKSHGEQDTYRKYMCYDYLLQSWTQTHFSMQLCICTPKQYVAWIVIRTKYVQIVLLIYVAHSLFYPAVTYRWVNSKGVGSCPTLCEVMCTAIVTLQHKCVHVLKLTTPTFAV